MGLDNYASRVEGEVRLSEEDKRAFEGAGIELCGGVFSGDAGSFRGKVYADVVLEVTGESLYQPWLAPETVRAMYDALNARTPEELARINDEVGYHRSAGETNADEMASLQCFFTICAGRGLGIIGWG